MVGFIGGWYVIWGCWKGDVGRLICCGSGCIGDVGMVLPEIFSNEELPCVSIFLGSVIVGSSFGSFLTGSSSSSVSVSVGSRPLQ